MLFRSKPFSHEKLTDLSPHLTSFFETAQAISRLDLVISVDSAVAHLAASMEKPTWILLSKVPDWRWLLTLDDSPWYPTARLFRQESFGDWTPVLGRVRKILLEILDL